MKGYKYTSSQRSSSDKLQKVILWLVRPIIIFETCGPMFLVLNNAL